MPCVVDTRALCTVIFTMYVIRAVEEDKKSVQTSHWSSSVHGAGSQASSLVSEVIYMEEECALPYSIPTNYNQADTYVSLEAL